MDNKEFEAKKQLLLIKIDALQKEFGEFTSEVSPSHWRSTGTHYGNLNEMTQDVQRYGQMTAAEKKIPWVQDAIKNGQL